MRATSELLEDVKNSIENRIKELEKTRGIYRVEIYLSRTKRAKHVEIFYKGRPRMCISKPTIKKKITPGFIKALLHYYSKSHIPDIKKVSLCIYPESADGIITDRDSYLARTYYVEEK